MTTTQTLNRYVFGAINQKLATGYLIKFINIDHLFAKGTTYDETVYYSYRVLSQYLHSLADSHKSLLPFTVQQMPQAQLDENTFLTLVHVSPDLDPHHMESSFVLPQARPSGLSKEAEHIGKLIRYADGS